MKDGGTVERDDDVEVEYTEDGTETGVGGTITGDWKMQHKLSRRDKERSISPESRTLLFVFSVKRCNERGIG